MGTQSVIFGHPPVNEVICGVQFQSLPQWTTAHYGRFWDRIQGTYPDSEDQQPLVPLNLDDKDKPPQFEASILPPMRRVFFLRRPGNFLLQLQPNRFLHNWRQISPVDEYPSYTRAFPEFLDQWRIFLRFLQDSGSAPPKLQGYELTYFNTITGEDVQFPRDVWNFLSFYERNPAAVPPTPPSALNIRFVWPLESGEGRLFLRVQHGNRISDQKSVLLLELTVRGRLETEDEPDLIARFEHAHEMIVQSFLKLTTENAHRQWELRT